MALQTQQKELVFSGVNQDIDDKLLPDGVLTVCRNYTFDKLGALRKRNGWERLANTNYTTGKLHTLFARGKQLVAWHENGELQTYTENSDDDWVTLAQDSDTGLGADLEPPDALPVSTSATRLLSADLFEVQPDVHDMALIGDVACVVWGGLDSTGTSPAIYLALYDTAKGATIYGPRVIAVGELYPRVFVLDSKFVVLTAEAAGGNNRINVYDFDPAALSNGPHGYPSRASILAGTDNAAEYDAYQSPGGSSIIIAVLGTTVITMGLLTRVGGTVVVSVSSNAATADGGDRLAVYLSERAADRYGFVAWRGTSNDIVKYRTFDFNTLGWLHAAFTVFNSTQLTAATMISINGTQKGTTDAMISVTDLDASPTPPAPKYSTHWAWVTNGGALVTSTIRHRSPYVQLAGHGFYDSSLGREFLRVFYTTEFDDATLEPSKWLVEPHVHIDDASENGMLAPVAQVFPDEARAADGNTVGPTRDRPWRVAIGSGVDTEWHFLALRITRTVPAKNEKIDRRYALDRVVVRLPADRALHSVDFRGVRVFAGAVPRIFDGQRMFECGALVAPRIQDSDADGVATVTYLYKAIFVMEDALGNQYRSRPSPAFTLQDTNTIEVTGSYNLEVSTPPLSQLPGFLRGYRIELYRTDAGGSVYYRTANSSLVTPGLDSVTVNDATTDADLIENELLYTESGEPANDPPPPLYDLHVAGDRAWGIHAQKRDTVHYTKPFRENQGMEWSNTQTLSFLGGDDLTAIGEIDGQPVFFTEASIFVVLGEGPNAAGGGGVFSVPQRLDTDVGCIGKHAMARIPGGILFKSDRGWYMLGRDLTTQYVGGPVSDFDSAEVRQVTLVESAREVRIVIGDSTDQILVYNYHRGQWSTFTANGVVNSTTYPTTAALWDGTYVWGMGRNETFGGAQIYKEGANPYELESGTREYIVGTIITGWIHLAGFAGFQRFRRATLLGRYRSKHDLSFRLYYDYDDADTEIVRVWNESDIVALGSYMLQLHVPRQKLTAVKIRLDATAPDLNADYGLSSDLTGIQLEIGVKRGAPKVQKEARG